MSNMSFRNKFINIIKRNLLLKIPVHISDKFRTIDSAGYEDIRSSLIRNYFSRHLWGDATVTAESYLSSTEGGDDLNNHLHNRLNTFRDMIIPWLSDAKSLFGATVLEIGCGTGSSTVALAEQGAKVIGVDIDEDSIAVAKDRCRAYGVHGTFYQSNVKDISRLLPDQPFDFIIFFASLEHMTIEERIAALKDTWDMLEAGGLLCIIDTPNRLWYYDFHTSRLPFYLWLPDDLAFKYSKFSPRQPFCRSYRDKTNESMLSFRRHGRGVSYHEFDLAIKKSEELNIVSSLATYLCRTKFYKIYYHAKMILSNNNYESFLTRVGPDIHRGFYEQCLNLIIRKD